MSRISGGRDTRTVVEEVRKTRPAIYPNIPITNLPRPQMVQTRSRLQIYAANVSTDYILASDAPPPFNHYVMMRAHSHAVTIKQGVSDIHIHIICRRNVVSVG